MMFDFSQIEEVRLAKGNHTSAAEGMCFMEMTAWFAGEKHSDKPECACPLLGTYGIRLNDEMPDDVRDRLLKPLVPLIAGTRDRDSEQSRAEFLAIWSVTKILPVVLWQCGFDELARRCERAATLSEAKHAANAAYIAVAAASPAVYVAANAAYIAHRATANAAVANAAVANAADAADAAAAAAAYAAYTYTDQIWEVAVEGFRQAILIGRHDGFDVAESVLSDRRAKLLELECAQ